MSHVNTFTNFDATLMFLAGLFMGLLMGLMWGFIGIRNYDRFLTWVRQQVMRANLFDLGNDISKFQRGEK